MNEGTRYKENPQSTMLYPLSQTTPSARPRSSKIVLGSTLGNQNVHPRQEHLHCHLKVTGGRRRNEGHKPPAYLCVLYAVFWDVAARCVHVLTARLLHCVPRRALCE